MAPCTQRPDHTFLLRRVDATKKVRRLNPRLQRVVIQIGDVLPGQGANDRYVQLCTDMAGDQFAVAGDDLDGNANTFECLQGWSGTGFWWIQKCGESGHVCLPMYW